MEEKPVLIHFVVSYNIIIVNHIQKKIQKKKNK